MAPQQAAETTSVVSFTFSSAAPSATRASNATIHHTPHPVMSSHHAVPQIQHGPSISTAAIAGIAVAGVLLLATIAGLVFWFCRKKRRQNRESIRLPEIAFESAGRDNRPPGPQNPPNIYVPGMQNPQSTNEIWMSKNGDYVKSPTVVQTADLGHRPVVDCYGDAGGGGKTGPVWRGGLGQVGPYEESVHSELEGDGAAPPMYPAEMGESNGVRRKPVEMPAGLK